MSITAITTRETWHGPGWGLESWGVTVPEGMQVELIPASNLPNDSCIQYWLEPDDDTPESWLDVAGGIGIGFSREEVAI